MGARGAGIGTDRGRRPGRSMARLIRLDMGSCSCRVAGEGMFGQSPPERNDAPQHGRIALRPAALWLRQCAGGRAKHVGGRRCDRRKRGSTWFDEKGEFVERRDRHRVGVPCAKTVVGMAGAVRHTCRDAGVDCGCALRLSMHRTGGAKNGSTDRTSQRLALPPVHVVERQHHTMILAIFKGARDLRICCDPFQRDS